MTVSQIKTIDKTITYFMLNMIVTKTLGNLAFTKDVGTPAERTTEVFSNIAKLTNELKR